MTRSCRSHPAMQSGVASARIEEKVKLMGLGPDMMAVAFNAHDEYFNPDPQFPPKRMTAIHPVEELLAYAKAADDKVKLEVECFTTGAFWNFEFVRKHGGYLRRKPTPLCSSAGRGEPGRRRPKRRSSTWSTTCRRTAFGT